MLAPVGGSLYKSSAVSQDELILALDEMTTLEEGRDASTAKTDRVHEQLASFAMELKLASVPAPAAEQRAETSEELRALLSKHGVDTAEWGAGAAKSVDDLQGEGHEEHGEGEGQGELESSRCGLRG